MNTFSSQRSNGTLINMRTNRRRYKYIFNYGGFTPYLRSENQRVMKLIKFENKGISMV